MRRLAQAAADRVGVQVTRQRPVRRWGAAYLRRLGSFPTVIDVGAAYGTHGLYEAFPEAEFYLVEPLQDYRPRLDAIAARYRCHLLPVAVGSREEERQILVDTGRLTRTTFLSRTRLTETGNRQERRLIRVTTLDAILASHPEMAGPVLLKIDTEGYELEVLRGAGRLLQLTDIVIAEVSVARRFHGSYTFAELVGEMDRSGFELFDFVKVRYLEGQAGLKSLDAVFRRRPADATRPAARAPAGGSRSAAGSSPPAPGAA